ncbi:MAG: type I DNA topoisomerase [Eubacteriaceae bacterium]|nr:type I DNA topoisomerase [Eubacteriaceae bacterium]
MGKTLVIVESPAKASTIKKYLPAGCEVTATMGHVIDLPASTLGVDEENDFKPKYITIKGKAPILKEIRTKAKKADEVILATDPDREGEIISYHLANHLGMDLGAKNRIEFHEITQNAISRAMENKRSIDLNLVDAQQARRVLDRLVGYKISPVLWKKITKGLSAGRVQSAATRIIVDREDEINAFVPEEYWNITALLHKAEDERIFEAKLTKAGSRKITVSDEQTAQRIVSQLEAGEYVTLKVTKAKKTRKPYAPFTTSTLQQDSAHKLNYSAKKTMSIAQMLYEGLEVEGMGHVGLITYIRTDSVRVADEAQAAAKALIEEKYGKAYYARNTYGKKGKIQDAHEAIRPANLSLTPEELKKKLTRDQYNLYNLIYKRFVASQMASAVYDTTGADIQNGKYTLHASGSLLTFPGFMKVYDSADPTADTTMPQIEEGEKLIAQRTLSEQKFTQPPARYTEASLIKALEELGIGRPSTYAPTISTIQQRDYVTVEEKKFRPTDLGVTVTKLMKENFPDIVDVGFTADMETRLDGVAEGKLMWVKVIEDFYAKLKEELAAAEDIEKVEMPVIVSEEVCPNCGRNLIVKSGRFGKFLACPGYPECKYTLAITSKAGAKCPKCGGEVIIRKTKKGRIFYGCSSYPKCDFISWYKPAGEKCPNCSEELYFTAGGDKVFCQNKECGYKRQ